MSRVDLMPLAERDRSGGRTIITAGWGDGRGHQGVDLGTTDGIEVGTPVYAPADGAIIRISDDGPYRNGRHTAGLNLWFLCADGRRYKMFHLNRITYPKDQYASAGTLIAEVGNTGTIAAHLHWEEHRLSWSNPIDFTSNVRVAIAERRWPNQAAPIVPPTPNVDPSPALEGDMPKQYQFPQNGPTYVLVPAVKVETKTESGWSTIDNPMGWAWQNVPGPFTRDGGVKAGAFAVTVEPLAQGNNDNDALFELFPVLNGPHKRGTYQAP